MLRLFAHLVFASMWLFAGPSLAGDDFNQRLESERERARALQMERDKVAKELEETLRSEREVMARLDHIDRELDRLRGQSQAIKREITAAQDLLNEAQGKTEALRRKIHTMEGRFRKRLVALYKTQRVGYPALILSAHSPQDALRLYHYVFCIAQQDAHRLQEVRSSVQEWQKAKALQRARKDKLLTLRKANFDQRRAIQLQRLQKRQLLSALRERKELQKDALKEHEQAAARLQALIRSLDRDVQRAPEASSGNRPEDGGFHQLKGHLAFPVHGRLTTRFGKEFHPLLNTYAFHNGVEIEAPEGEPIRAVYSGQVVFGGWLRGYGNVLIIDHGGGYYSLSGHASRILSDVGERVKRGQIIGYVGDTGAFGGPSLYFEIRKGGKPLNPLDWFRPGSMRATRR